MKIQGKTDIRNAALDIIAYDGIEKLTIANLAKELDLSKATLYHYYESKDAILDDIYIQGHKALMAKGFRLSLTKNIREVLLSASKKWRDIFTDDDIAPYLRMCFSLHLTDERASDEYHSLTLMLKSQTDVIISSFSSAILERNKEILSSLFSSLLLSGLEKTLEEADYDIEKEISEFAFLLEQMSK